MLPLVLISFISKFSKAAYSGRDVFIFFQIVAISFNSVLMALLSICLEKNPNIRTTFNFSDPYL